MKNKKTVSYTTERLTLAETSRLKRLFIQVWYNNFFRFINIMGLPVILSLLFMAAVEITTGVKLAPYTLIIGYCVALFILMEYNDYENLHRIGKSVNGDPLPVRVVNNQKFYVRTIHKWRYEDEPERH